MLQGIKIVFFRFLLDTKIVHQEIHASTYIYLRGIKLRGLLEAVEMLYVINAVVVLRMLQVIVIV